MSGFWKASRLAAELEKKARLNQCIHECPLFLGGEGQGCWTPKEFNLRSDQKLSEFAHVQPSEWNYNKKSCSKKEREREVQSAQGLNIIYVILFLYFSLLWQIFHEFWSGLFFSGDIFVVNPCEKLTHASHYEVHQTFKQSSEESWLKKAAKEVFTSDSQVFAIHFFL